MKSLKSNPTSYKDFVDQLGKAKTNKSSSKFKIKGTPTANSSSRTNLHTVHTQSTCIW